MLARDDVDAVLISLPISLTYTVTKEALEAGKHVICEKPAGANLREAYAFLDLGRQYPDQVVVVAENWFYRDDLRFACFLPIPRVVTVRPESKVESRRFRGRGGSDLVPAHAQATRIWCGGTARGT